ncbi:MAG: hypothetical protein H6Q31_1569 [Bacteroidetes bacterium]|jgi:hypothetical protein|nr:hypothetical protein [Bacteroidota bacterium]
MRTLCWLALFMLIFGVRGVAEESASSRPTLHIMQDMMTSAADSLFALIPSSGLTVQTTLLPPATHWYLEQPALDALRKRDLVPSQSPDADYLAEFGVTRGGVLYENLRRTWFLGSQIVDRSVHLTVWMKLVERKTGTVLAARESMRSFTDTVDVADVETLETPGIPATRGALPPAGLFGSLVEPVVLVGSIAVAIVLLFSVRS